MIESISNYLEESVGAYWCVFFCAMIPIIELRGAIPLGIGFGLNPWIVYLLAVLGNMLPVPLVLFFIEKFIEWCARSNVKFLNKFGSFLLRKAEKNREKIEKFGFFGVCLFVTIPLPVTGAWTGSLVAAIIHMKWWKAALSCLLGVMIAGVIVLAISVGVAALFS